MDIYRVIREPHVTEKAGSQKKLANQISFKVNKSANKIEIRRSVETLFKTKVVGVNVLNVKGKKRRVGKNIGKRPDWRKAIVTLAPGEHVEFFEGI